MGNDNFVSFYSKEKKPRPLSSLPPEIKVCFSHQFRKALYTLGSIKLPSEHLKFKLYTEIYAEQHGFIHMYLLYIGKKLVLYFCDFLHVLPVVYSGYLCDKCEKIFTYSIFINLRSQVIISNNLLVLGFQRFL